MTTTPKGPRTDSSSEPTEVDRALAAAYPDTYHLFEGEPDPAPEAKAEAKKG